MKHGICGLENEQLNMCFEMSNKPPTKQKNTTVLELASTNFILNILSLTYYRLQIIVYILFLSKSQDSVQTFVVFPDREYGRHVPVSLSYSVRAAYMPEIIYLGWTNQLLAVFESTQTFVKHS